MVASSKDQLTSRIGELVLIYKNGESLQSHSGTASLYARASDHCFIILTAAHNLLVKDKGQDQGRNPEEGYFFL
jgi:hypothetical protein